MIDVFVPSEDDFTRVTHAIEADFRDTRLDAGRYFSILERNIIGPHTARLFAPTVEALLPRDRITGRYHEQADTQRALARAGFGLGLFYTTRFAFEAGTLRMPATIQEVIGTIEKTRRFLIHDVSSSSGSDLDVRDEDTRFVIAETFRERGARGLVGAGEETERAVEGWAEAITPIIDAHSYFRIGAGLILGVTVEVSRHHQEEEKRRDLAKLELELADAHEIDWNQLLSE